jgi:hypothetical protein
MVKGQVKIINDQPRKAKYQYTKLNNLKKMKEFLISRGAKSLHHTPAAIGNLPVDIQKHIEICFRGTGNNISSPR